MGLEEKCGHLDDDDDDDDEEEEEEEEEEEGKECTVAQRCAMKRQKLRVVLVSGECSPFPE